MTQTRRAFLAALTGGLSILSPEFGRWYRQGTGQRILTQPNLLLVHPEDWQTMEWVRWTMRVRPMPSMEVGDVVEVYAPHPFLAPNDPRNLMLTGVMELKDGELVASGMAFMDRHVQPIIRVRSQKPAPLIEPGNFTLRLMTEEPR